MNINGLKVKVKSKIEKDRTIYKTQEISINILNNKNIIGLFLIETKLKRFDKNIQIPQ